MSALVDYLFGVGDDALESGQMDTLDVLVQQPAWRMGDLAEHVAKQARMRYPRPAVPQELRATFAVMGGIAEEIVSKTGSVIATQDVNLVADIARHDAEMDRLHRELFTIVMSPSWTQGVEAAIDVTLLSRYYERYADHAVSVTRRVVTIVTGEPYVGVSLG